MSVLLENGANVNMQDKEGHTALHWACRSGSLEAVKLLVARYNAKVNMMEFTRQKYTPLDYALIGDHQDVALVCNLFEAPLQLIYFRLSCQSGGIILKILCNDEARH